MNSRMGLPIVGAALFCSFFTPTTAAIAQDTAAQQSQEIPASALTTKTVEAVGYLVGSAANSMKGS